MLGWKEIVQGYICKHSKRITKTTQPLRDHFGIGYFTYHKIDYSGKYTVLVDRPEWAEYYVDEKIYLNDPYLRHPSVYQSGMCFLGNHGSKEYKETIYQGGRKVLGMDSGVILIQKNENSAEFFGFSGNNDTCCLDKLYLNHPQIFTSFANHFKKELSPILTRMEREAGSLINLKGKDFNCIQPIAPALEPSKLIEFYRDLGMGTEIEQAKKLSPREVECLRFLAQDKTAKEIGYILGLSVRTIEFYFENIKNKLSCWNRQELLQLARAYKDMGIV